jgi:sulfur carrier protein
MVNVTLNGNPTTVTKESTVADVVASLAGPDARRGVAVAVNGEVVPRTGWAGIGLSDGDRIEVLIATQGG